MVEFEYLDETLDINATSSYHLSIQAGLDGLSFAILDLPRNKYVALKNYAPTEKPETGNDPLWFKSVVKSDEFLGKEYRSVALVWVTQHATLVPAPLFKKEHLMEYFTFNLDLSASEEILSNKIKRAEAWSIYPIPSQVIRFFNKLYPALNIFHQSVPFINTLLQVQKNGSSENQVFVHLYGNLFDIAVTFKKNLKLYNSYSYKHVNDLLYFILYTFDQLKIPSEKTSVFLSGKVTRQSSLYENLKRYVKKPVFRKLDTNYTYSYTFGKLPEHAYVNLLNLYPCVL